MPKDYSRSALIYAEHNGIYEYTVTGRSMEYWSLYDDGFFRYRVNLDTETREEVEHIDWQPGDEVPPFLLSLKGYPLYNYFEG